MHLVTKRLMVDAFPMDTASIADPLSWPAWVAELVRYKRLRFAPAPMQTSDGPAVAELDTKAGQWRVAPDDMLVLFPDGIVTPIALDLMDLLFASVPRAHVAAASPPAQPTGDPSAPAQDR